MKGRTPRSGGIVDAAIGDTVCGLGLGHLGAVDNLGDTLFSATLAQSNTCGGSVAQNMASQWPGKGVKGGRNQYKAGKDNGAS